MLLRLSNFVSTQGMVAARAAGEQPTSSSITPQRKAALRGYLPIWVFFTAMLFYPSMTAFSRDLVGNGLFSQGKRVPAGWKFVAFYDTPDAASSEWTMDSWGAGVLKITNLKPNDTRWTQVVAVSPLTWYRISGWIRTQDVGNEGGGAYLADMDDGYYSDEIRGTQAWQSVEYWIRTAPTQRSVELACRLGGYGSLNTGTAYFTGISFTRAGTPPAGARVFPEGELDEGSQPQGLTDRGVLAVLGAAALIGFALALLRFAPRTGSATCPGSSRGTSRLVAPAITENVARDMPADTRFVIGLFSLTLAIIAVYATILSRWGGIPDRLTIVAAMLAAAGLALVPLTNSKNILRLNLSFDQWSFCAVFILFLAFYSATKRGPTPFNQHVYQAQAFLEGHSWVQAPDYMEQVKFQGRSYLLHPAAAALVMLPVVALWGLGANQQTVCIILGALDVALVWRLLGVLELTTSARVWLTLFFGVGTIVWYEATLGAAWGFCLILSLAPTLCALSELFGKGRPIVVGMFAGLAALARYDLFMVWPVYALLLIVRGQRLRNLLWLAPGFAMAGLVYVTFNETRFGTVFDIGLWLWYQYDGEGLKSHPGTAGPFRLANLPSNIYTLFFMAPNFTSEFPYIHPQGAGQAMLLTSPAFVLALRSNFRRPIPLLLLLGCILTEIGVLTYYVNGFTQFGTRYYIQIYPFLIVLIALGMSHVPDQFTKILILASVVIVSYGIWHIQMYGFG